VGEMSHAKARRLFPACSAQKQRGHQRCMAASRRGLLPGTLSRSTSPPCTQSTAALPLMHHTTHTHLHLEVERCQPGDLLLLRHLSRLHCRLDGQCWSGPRPLRRVQQAQQIEQRCVMSSHSRRQTATDLARGCASAQAARAGSVCLAYAVLQSVRRLCKKGDRAHAESSRCRA
jgi:hypothetical protein